jgi:hypothetical protein
MHRDDPADISIDERLDEVASLLATGFLSFFFKGTELLRGRG